jgi:hypothetical protein
MTHIRQKPRRRVARRGILAMAALALASGVALAQIGFEFMPDGGRNLMVQVLDADPGRLAEVGTMTLDAEGWQAWITEGQSTDAQIALTQTALAEAEVMTLASYMALNLPLADPETLGALGPEDLAAALPRDGKDLAVRNCQGCHGFYTAYLGHDRDANGWMVMFNSPFHTEIPMNRTERLTFAHYSAINLPMRLEDVPPDLRH